MSSAAEYTRPKGPSVAIHAQKFIIYARRHWLEAAEVGQIFDDIARALERRDFEAVKKYPFTGRIILGTNTRPSIPKDVRARVLLAGLCARCGSTHKLEVDHIIPYSRGGAHDESNFQVLCQRCNRTKHAKLESEL